MVIVIGSTTVAERLQKAIESRAGGCQRVPCPEGNSAEDRVHAARAAIESAGGGSPLVVAATGEDERNLVSAALARRLGARPVVAVVESASLAAQAALTEVMGVDRVIEPDVEAAGAVVERIIGPVAAAVHSLGQGQIRTAELIIPAEGGAVGRPLRDHTLPRGARVALIRRAGKDAVAPTAATVLEPGDRVLLVANRAVAAEAASSFGSVPQDGPRALVLRGSGTSPERRDRFLRLLREADVQASAGDEPGPDRGTGSTVLVLLDPDAESMSRYRAAGQARLVAVGPAREDIERPSGLSPDSWIHPIDAVGRAIAAMLPRPAVERVGSLAPGVLDVYRVRAGESGEWLGGPLRQTPGMRGWIVLATQSGAHAHLPHPEDAIEPGDVLIVAGPPNAESTLERAVGRSGRRAVA